MIVDCFLDTNVLLYAASRNPADARKKRIAAELIQEKSFALSVQVAQEFYVVATRKADFKMAPEKALEWLETLEEFPCLPLDMTIVRHAVYLSSRYAISYWDGAILAAAEASGAPVVYSEDLGHGQCYGQLRVCNPFLEEPSFGFHDAGAPFRPEGPAGAAASQIPNRALKG
jgi:predicted nucleic acid-binding protein